jgi:diamine N-acetyltransferase
MSVSLIELSTNSWRECARLQVSEEHKGTFSSNLYRIAQAKYDPSLILCAIHNADGVMVGLVVYAHRYQPHGMEREPEGHWSLVHLMIDRNHQSKGYGRAAVESVIGLIRESGNARMLSLSYAPANTVARRLYKSLGFQDTGEMNGNELVARLQITLPGECAT